MMHYSNDTRYMRHEAPSPSRLGSLNCRKGTVKPATSATLHCVRALFFVLVRARFVSGSLELGPRGSTKSTWTTHHSLLCQTLTSLVDHTVCWCIVIVVRQMMLICQSPLCVRDHVRRPTCFANCTVFALYSQSIDIAIQVRAFITGTIVFRDLSLSHLLVVQCTTWLTEFVLFIVIFNNNFVNFTPSSTYIFELSLSYH